MHDWSELWGALYILKMFCNHLLFRTIDLYLSHKQTFLSHCHKKWKDSLETWVVLSTFLLELEMSGVTVQGIHQNSKKGLLSWGIAQWKWLSHFQLLWLWCQLFWGSSEDRYRSKRLSLMLFVCYSLLNRQNISVKDSQKRLVTYLLGYLRGS